MSFVCATRHVKNAKFLQVNAPEIMPAREPIDGYASRVPADLLGRLHLSAADARLGAEPRLIRALARVPFPPQKVTAFAPLFNGSLVFAEITFNTSRGGISLPPADLRTAMQFARLAAQPISRYASQYGANRIDIAPAPVSFTASVPTGRFNDQTLQGWVNEIATRNALAANTCVVVLNPLGVVNADADPKKGVGGYHSLANVPYAFVNAMGTGFTVPDEAGIYALALSHEIAEMAVDPAADLSNPECCDGCGPNCQTVWMDYFDQTGRYLGTTQRLPLPPGYAFFINGIVKPASSTLCPAPAAACNYPPP